MLKWFKNKFIKPLIIDNNQSIKDKIMRLISDENCLLEIRNIKYLGGYIYDEEKLEKLKTKINKEEQILAGLLNYHVQKDNIELYVVENAVHKKYLVIIFSPFELLKEDRLIDVIELNDIYNFQGSEVYRKD